MGLRALGMSIGGNRRTLATLGLLLFGQMIACSGRTEGVRGSSTDELVLAGTDYDVSLTTPAGVAYEDVTLGSTAGISVETGARIEAGSGKAIVTNVSSPLAPGVALAPLALAGTAYSTSSISVASTAKLTGDALSPVVTVLPGGSVAGVINRSPTLTPAVVATFKVSFPQAQAGSVVALPLIPASITAGRYGPVQILTAGMLTLTTGDYYFEDLVASAGSTLRIDDSAGPVRVYVRGHFDLSGALASTQAGRAASLLLVDVGVLPSFLHSPYRGVIVAPSATVTLGGAAAQHKGAFFAKFIDVESGVKVAFEPANALAPLLQPAKQGLQACAEAIRPRVDLTEPQRSATYQADIAFYCSMAGAPRDLTDVTGAINADYSSAAAALVAQIKTPAQYLAVVRDRSRKKRAAEDDPAKAAVLAAGPDDDADRVVNSQDRCPNTPPLTPTDDQGCSDPSLPDAPPAADVAYLLQGGLILNSGCAGNKVVPSTPRMGYYIYGAGTGSFLWAGRVTNQSPGCPVWYFFDIEDYTSGSAVQRYAVAFMDREETTSIAGSGRPVPTGYIQFHANPGDLGTRGILAAAKAIRFRVKVMNGGGMTGGWSEWWTRPTEQDCEALGITCP